MKHTSSRTFLTRTLAALLAACTLATAARAQCELAKVTAGDADPDDDFGVAVWLGSGMAVIGADDADPVGLSSGAAYVFEGSAGVWTQTAELSASDGAAEHHFGIAVSGGADRVLVGANLADGAQPGAGAAYVFDHVGSDWIEVAKLTAGDGTTGSRFGSSVSLSGDRALVGAFADNGAGPVAGAAYVFERQGTDWVETAKLTATIPLFAASFGFSVALDGDRALIGAPGGLIIPLPPEEAHVFELIGPSWVQTAVFVPSDPQLGNRFGQAVALDGDVALIGAPADDPLGVISAGSAYVFEQEAGLWSETQKVFSNELRSLAAFGVALAVDGDSFLVGEGGLSMGAVFGSGTARAFRRTLAGSWVETELLFGADGGVQDSFGISVGLHDGLALSGASLHDSAGDGAGAAYFHSVAPLCGVPASVSASLGGSQELRLNAGPDFAGDLYFLVGSATGTSPGSVHDGVVLPLVNDAYHLYTVLAPNLPPLSNSLSFLDAGDGTAGAAFTLPPGLGGLAGLTLYHAYLVFDVGGPTPPAVFASNPQSVELTP